jgi:hypothetical protein
MTTRDVLQGHIDYLAGCAHNVRVPARVNMTGKDVDAKYCPMCGVLFVPGEDTFVPAAVARLVGALRVADRAVDQLNVALETERLEQRAAWGALARSLKAMGLFSTQQLVSVGIGFYCAYGWNPLDAISEVIEAGDVCTDRPNPAA